MSLWKPYAEDAALDLTKTSARLNSESNSPSTGYHQFSTYSTLQAGYPSLQPVASYPAAYYGYSYTAPNYVVPAAQTSPYTSGGSTCSGYEASVPAIPLSPHFVVRPGTLSPPESPVSPNAREVPNMDADGLSDDPEFQAFEQDALRAMAEKNGGTLLGTNPRMRRAVRSTNLDSDNDSYRKQRERNNFAAKQSRDRRKLREIHLALKVSYLKKEMASLKAKLAARVCDRCGQSCEC